MVYNCMYICRGITPKQKYLFLISEETCVMTVQRCMPGRNLNRQITIDLVVGMGIEL